MTPLVLSLAFTLAADPPPLTIGSPAPQWATMEIVKRLADLEATLKEYTGK